MSVVNITYLLGHEKGAFGVRMASERCGTACVQMGLEDAVEVVAKDIVEVVVEAAQRRVWG